MRSRAAKLALGPALTQVQNSVTHTTCAGFEPALDYVVVKAPPAIRPPRRNSRIVPQDL